MTYHHPITPGQSATPWGAIPIRNAPTDPLDAIARDAVLYREKWTAERTRAALSCNMLAVALAQTHIDAAASKLVEIAGKVAKRGQSL